MAGKGDVMDRIKAGLLTVEQVPEAYRDEIEQKIK